MTAHQPFQTPHPPGPAPRVLQGCFPGGRQRLLALAQHAAAVQRATRPAAVQPAPARAPQRPGVPPPLPPRGAALQAQPAGGSHALRLPDGAVDPGRGGRGQPLPEPVRRQMESVFRTDFSDVRVHVGPEAPTLGAVAFTLGADLYFAPGQYAPETQRGRHLLGHELAHVVQQRAGRVRNPYGAGLAVVQDPALEAEADRMGQQAAVQAALPPRPAAAAGHGPGGGAVQPGAGSYRLVLGAYMHRGTGAEPLPADLAGHTFVSIQEPTGRSQTWGFSPSDTADYDPGRDLGRLRTGVRGAVHDDSCAFGKPGVRTRSYPVSAEQAQAALAKVAEYRSATYAFSLDRRQCSTFALDVLRAARVEPVQGGGVRGPREVYDRL